MGSFSSLLKAQTAPDRLNNLARAQRNVNLHGCGGFLKRGELAVEQLGVQEMTAALPEALSNKLIVTLEVNQNDPFID
jgi:hypothetical protein